MVYIYNACNNVGKKNLTSPTIRIDPSWVKKRLLSRAARGPLQVIRCKAHEIEPQGFDLPELPKAAKAMGSFPTGWTTNKNPKETTLG